MSKEKPTKKTAAGYNLVALNQEKRTLSRESRQRWGGNPAKQGAQWKSTEKSPLAPILAKRPGFKVLIVDDNKPIRHLIRSILLAFGIENVTEATDGRSAIRKLQDTLPDLVITDLEMAPMNGLQFARLVQTNPLSPDPDLPIIIMTGHTEMQRIMEIREAGLTEIMAKPITPNFLSRNILVAMDKYDQKKARLAEEKKEDSDDFFTI